MKAFRQQHDETDSAPNAQALTDGQLLGRFIERADPEAFATLVQIHGPMVLGVCRRITAHHHDAEEAFQNAFLVLARKAASVRPREMVAGWLYGVAYRTALKVRTATVQRRAKEKQVATMPEPVAPQAGEWNELAPVLDRELNRLSDHLRAAVVSCDIEGRSRLEAARQLGWPEGTLKVRLSRARSVLARRLARQGVVLSVGTLAAVVAENAASAAVPSALVAVTTKAAGALAATQAVPTTAIGTKGTVLAKGLLKSLFLGKAAVATTAAGVTVAAALLLTSAAKPTPAKQLSELQLPSDVQQALEDNARQLSPISIACTMRMVSKLAPAETFERLKINELQTPDHFFAEHPGRIVWQDNKMYLQCKYIFGEGDNQTTSTSEIVYDGPTVFVGSSSTLSKAMLAQQKKGAGAGTPITQSLTKDPLAKALQRQPPGLGADNAYFNHSAGLLLAARSRAAGSDAAGSELTSRADSAVLHCLKNGWKLLSVESLLVDGRRQVRIEMEGDNAIRTGALAFDLDALRKRLQRNREANEKQAARLSAQLKEMMARSDRQQEARARLIEEQRKLPATRRYVFYLDPDLHYAVRRFEQSYGPDSLLARTDCSQFQQVPGRQLWLPRKMEAQLHEFYSLPGTILNDAFLSQVVEVSSIDGSRVPDETFKLDYSAPGTYIRDGTDPAAAKSQTGYISYVIPARPEGLPAVIEQARKGGNMLQLAGAGPLAASPELAVASHRNQALLTIVLSNLAVIGAGAAYVVWKRNRGESV